MVAADMIKFRNLLLLAALAPISGCQTVARPSVSYVSVNLPAAEATQLAADAVSYLSDELPPARTTIIITSRAVGIDEDQVTSAMTAALRNTGYGVVTANLARQDKIPGVALRFLVSRLEEGILLRFQYNGHEAARFYIRTPTEGLVPVSSFTVRKLLP
ncbi:hypothetical protein Brsp01_34700 [Brucella sp. NBRC 12950]|nr:hypothetical protein Brsp01_34700 [Brucella sp. NBRC 12950]